MKSKPSEPTRLLAVQEKWRRADHTANMAHAVLESAHERMSKGDEGSAFLLMEAAKCILDQYVDR